MTRYIKFLIASFFGLLASIQTANAQLNIDITQGNLDPVPIAIPDFLSTDSQGRDIGAKIAEVVRADLERSGIFKSLSPSSFLETQTNIDYKPTFADWRVIKAEALVSGRVVVESSNRIRVEYRLWDITAGEQLSGIRFGTAPNQWRRIAHKVSDSIYKKLTLSLIHI